MPQPISRLLRANSVRTIVLGLLVLLSRAHAGRMYAQTAGEGTITGTVTDGSGAVIANATVTATAIATNTSATRTTSKDGLYSIAPLEPGIYTATVEAKGFKTLKQENLDVVGLGVLGFNPVLAIGEATENVVVTAAPPVLDTDSATLGAVIENSAYSSLRSRPSPPKSETQLLLPSSFKAQCPAPTVACRHSAEPLAIRLRFTSTAFLPRPSISRVTTAPSP